MTDEAGQSFRDRQQTPRLPRRNPSPPTRCTGALWRHSRTTSRRRRLQGRPGRVSGALDGLDVHVVDNPAVFNRRNFPALAAVNGERGGRALLETEPVRRVAADDPVVCADVDTTDGLDTLGCG